MSEAHHTNLKRALEEFARGSDEKETGLLRRSYLKKSGQGKLLSIIEYLQSQGSTQVIVKDGMIYLPIKADSPAYDELEKSQEQAIELAGNKYLEGIALSSLVANLEATDPDVCMAMRQSIEKGLEKGFEIKKVQLNKSLEMLLFEVAPTLTSFKKGNEYILDRRTSKGDILKSLKEVHGYAPPARFIEKSKQLADQDFMDSYTRELESLGNSTGSGQLHDGIYPLESINSFLMDKLILSTVSKMRTNIEEIQAQVKEKKDKAVEEAAMLLYLDTLKEIRLGDFGIIKRESGRYIIYKETGEFALKDFDGKVYKFPSAQVGVSVSPSENYVSDPIVVNRYKHPFVAGEGALQHMCILNRYSYSGDFRNIIIQKVNEGITTLLHGYFNDDHAGYRQLNGRRVSRGSTTGMDRGYFDEFLAAGSVKEFEKKDKTPITNLADMERGKR